MGRENTAGIVSSTKKSADDSTDFLIGGRWWIRTTEVEDNRFTVCPLWPLGKSPLFSFPYPQYNGAGGRTRTPDLLITNQLLYQLSYTSKCFGNRRSQYLSHYSVAGVVCQHVFAFFARFSIFPRQRAFGAGLCPVPLGGHFLFFCFLLSGCCQIKPIAPGQKGVSVYSILNSILIYAAVFLHHPVGAGVIIVTSNQRFCNAQLLRLF